jgi:hypothetical protein
MPYALLSEWDRLTPAQRANVTHLIPDDGEWSRDQIQTWLNENYYQPIDTKEQEEQGR